jgi:histone H3/H4
MVRAIGAAPLDEVPKGVMVDWVVVVANPYNAGNIACCRACQDGVLPYAEIGTSLCGVLFATPWQMKNIVVTFGDFGGRMHNRIKQDQLFVIIPTEFLEYIPMLFKDLKVDVKASRIMTKPAHSSFWQKGEGSEEKGEAVVAEQERPATSSLPFTMEWDDEAKELMKKVPEGILEMVIGNAEEFAREKGYTRVSKKSIQELMEKLGMNLDDMI